MKTILAFLLVTAATVSASDNRIVGGASVDLQPLHDWHESRKGERPLPQWSQVHVLAINGNSSSTAKLHVKIEDRAETDILAKNLPAEIVQYFSQVSGLTAQINQLKDYIASQQVVLDRASAAGSDAKATGNSYARPCQPQHGQATPERKTRPTAEPSTSAWPTAGQGGKRHERLCAVDRREIQRA